MVVAQRDSLVFVDTASQRWLGKLNLASEGIYVDAEDHVYVIKYDLTIVDGKKREIIKTVPLSYGGQPIVLIDTDVAVNAQGEIFIGGGESLPTSQNEVYFLSGMDDTTPSLIYTEAICPLIASSCSDAFTSMAFVGDWLLMNGRVYQILE